MQLVLYDVRQRVRVLLNSYPGHNLHPDVAARVPDDDIHCVLAPTERQQLSFVPKEPVNDVFAPVKNSMPGVHKAEFMPLSTATTPKSTPSASKYVLRLLNHITEAFSLDILDTSKYGTAGDACIPGITRTQTKQCPVRRYCYHP